MSDTAQDFQKLLTEAIHKQIIILGPQITLLKAHNVPGMTVDEDGTVIALSGNQNDVVTQFLEQFREISAPLLKKTMKPLLSTIVSGPSQSYETKHETPNEIKQEANKI